MYAVIRKATFDEKKLAQSQRQMQEFDAIHTAQPGYRGNLVVDAGSGNMVIVNLWASAADAQAAMKVLTPAVQRLIDPFTTSPGEVVGAGEVARQDLPLTKAA